MPDGSYAATALTPGTYDVRVSATGFCNEVRTGIVATAGNATTVNITMSQPGSAVGKVTQADGVTPIPGAAVTAFLTSASQGTTGTNSTGDYSLSNLHPGAYTLQIVMPGYQTLETGIIVSENATTTANASLPPAPSGSITYVYDDLNRLVSVTDAAGRSANYTYDLVGNLLSITRAGSGVVSISDFTPNSGPVGTAVTIYGTGFSATPSQNGVTFNGVAAPVTAATPTQITCTVPSAATTGPIGVAAPGGSATTFSPFTVTSAPPGAPTITSFSPNVGTAGTTVTINGTNFDPTLANNRVAFNNSFAGVSTASTTALAAAVPAPATSGRVSVATPAGTGISSVDFFVPPAPYTAANVLVTDRMAVGANDTLTFGTAGKLGIVVFDGAAGQSVSLQITNVTITTATIKMYDPAGVLLANTITYSSGAFIDPVALPASGTYSIVVIPGSSYTGSLTLSLYNVVDLTGTIVPNGASVPVAMSTPGQKAYLTFTAAAGQRASLKLTNNTLPTYPNCGAAITVRDSTQAAVASSSCVNSATWFLDAFTLAAGGTYTIVIDPAAAYTGSMTATLYAFTDIAGSIAPGGASVPLSLTVPGQNATLAFSAAAGQRVSVYFTNNTVSTYPYCEMAVSLKDSGGNALRSSNCVTSGNVFLDTVSLTGGNYTVVVDPAGATTLGITVTVYEVPPDVGGTIVPGGASVPISLWARTERRDRLHRVVRPAGQRVLHEQPVHVSQLRHERRAEGQRRKRAAVEELRDE